MKNLKYIISAGTCLLLTIFLSTSCTDGNDWEVIEANRLFGPTQGDFSLTADDEIAQIEITWKGVKDAQGYVLEISTEPLSNDIALGEAAGSQVFGNDGEKISSPLTVKELLPETNYYARIKAVGSNKESYWVYAEKSVKTTKEQLLEIPTEDAGDITKESIRVSWTEGCNVTALRISSNSASTPYEETFILEEADKEACSFLFEGLSSLTEYTIELLNNDIIRGTIKVTTAQGEMIEVTVDELTHNSASFSWAEVADAYTLVPGESPTADGAEAFPAGSATTFTASNLKGSTTYTFSVIKNGAIIGYATFETEYEAPANAIDIESFEAFKNAITNGNGDIALNLISDITLNEEVIVPATTTSLTIFCTSTTPIRYTKADKGDLVVAADASLTKIEFYNIYCIDETTSGYLLNVKNSFQVNDITANRLSLSNFRGIIRTQTTANATKFGTITFNNCVITNIGSYGILNTKVSGVELAKISMANTTVNQTSSGSMFTLLQTPKITIDRCTFYNLAKGKTVIDTNKVKAGSITITNTLVGMTEATKGYEGPTLKFSDSFTTNDCSFGSKNTWGTALDISSADLFTDPANGNFTVKEAKYKVYGDPRWNK